MWPFCVHQKFKLNYILITSLVHLDTNQLIRYYLVFDTCSFVSYNERFCDDVRSKSNVFENSI